MRASAASGLVPVPTTNTRGPKVPQWEVERLCRDVGAFVVDKDANRLARLRRSVGFAARAIGVQQPLGRRPDVPYMVTLTYRGDNRDWRPDHITSALKACREWARRQGFKLRYVWVAELQTRGVIHYHACIWLPHGVRMPKWDVRGWWPHGMANRKVARKAVPYLMKYLSKGSFDGGQFPHGSRVHGAGGLETGLRLGRRWLGLPRCVQGNSSIFDRWTRCEGGGWISPRGTFVPSEFRRVVVAGCTALQRVFKHRTAIDAHGPFCWLTDREKAMAVYGR